MSICKVLHWHFYYQCFFVVMLNSFFTLNHNPASPCSHPLIFSASVLSDTIISLSLFHTPPLSLASFPGIHLAGDLSAALLFFALCLRNNLFAVHSQLVLLSWFPCSLFDTNCMLSINLSYSSIFRRKSTSCSNLAVWSSHATANWQY